MILYLISPKITIGSKIMRIKKCNNGLFEVTLKGIEQPFYAESYNKALEIAWRIRGGRA